MSSFEVVRVLSSGPDCPKLPLVEGKGSAHAIVHPGTGAKLRSMHRISLEAGSRTKRQTHQMEAVYYVMSGTGTVSEPEQLIVEGSMVHIEPGTAYAFKAGAEGMELLGGPCPADPACYR